MVFQLSMLNSVELVKENREMEELRGRIMHETDLLLLKKWLKLAARADSVEQFAKEIF